MALCHLKFNYLLLFLTLIVVVIRAEIKTRKTIHFNHDINKRSPLIIDSKNDEEYFRPVGSDRNKRSTDESSKSNITTKLTYLNDSHQQLMVHWVGVGSDVVICLARNPKSNLYNINLPTIPSSVFISYDYGDTFINQTEHFILEDNNTYASLDKFYNHPKFNSYCVFADSEHQTIFTTTDNGKTIERRTLHFRPSEISFIEDDPHMFLAYDKESPTKTLYVTLDFGKTWTEVQVMVKSYYWSGSSTVDADLGTTVLPMKDYPFKENINLELFVVREEPSGLSTVISSPSIFQTKSEKKIWIADVSDFQIKGDFMFATKIIDKNNHELYVSYRRGPFVKAQFPTELDQQDYHIADVSDGQVMVVVSHTNSLAHLYTSQSIDSKSMTFSLSLERILCFFPNSTWKDSWLTDVTYDSFADLHKVEGLKGIYIASQVLPSTSPVNIGPEHLLSLITFDRGGEWKPLQPPMFDHDGQKIKCELSDGCSLHLSQKFSNLYPVTRNVPILSTKSAPGIILATGVIGHSLKGHAGIYLSRDGGLTWRQILRDYYFYNLGDHGGVLVAVKYFKTQGETRELLYSTDEGEKFSSYEFHVEDLRVYGLMTEPGENTTVFTMFGSAKGHHQWLIVKVDLKNAFAYDCKSEDYKFWSPSSRSGPRMPCVLGMKETYERRVPHSNCYNGKDYDRPIKMETCDCDSEDFECDFGFVRNPTSNQCMRNKTLKFDPYAVPAQCPPDQFYNRTKGYKKVPGDACVDGRAKHYLPDVIPCPLQEKKEFLIVAQRDRVCRLDLKEPKLEILPVTGLKNVIAVEFDMKNNCIYWADIVNDTIGRQCLSDGKSEVEILVESNLVSVEGMALDWVSNHLYFVDGSRAVIEVIRTDINNQGRMRKTVLGKRDLRKPRGVAVHPKLGYLFWTDWDTAEPAVARSNLDGSSVKNLFTRPTVAWPNGITIDHIAERIYWVDAKLNYISSSDLDGRRYTPVIQNDDRVTHPFAVAVFKDNMYWDDWKENSIFVADKDHGVDITPLTTRLPGLMDLKVFAHSVQDGINPCANNTCSHLCFGAPGNTYTCQCPEQMEMRNGQCFCPGSQKPNVNGTCPPVGQTCATNFFQCNNKLCIPTLWKCDGDDDCGDSSDEASCNKPTCPETMFQCKGDTDAKCIPPYWKCDFDADCEDGSDEKDCKYEECKDDQFRCKNGRCVSSRWKCDGENDCRDNSDEEDCNLAKNSTGCLSSEFQCDELCIPKTWKCDGDIDCPHAQDEQNCTLNTCQSWQFQCKNNGCIFDSWRCDGENDCKDGSDEVNCTTTTTSKPASHNTTDDGHQDGVCNMWMFKCASSKKCIPFWWKCDTVNDCEDMSDEFGCNYNESDVRPNRPSGTTSPTPVVCKPHQFQCYSGECIQDSWVCDNMKDCEQGEDEKNCKGFTVNCPHDDEFMCRTDGSCIKFHQICDGIRQCPDGSDEINCKHPSPEPANPSCSPGYFSCDAARCIPLANFCDGHDDCYDGTDELDCNSNKKVYQVLRLGVDGHVMTSTSLSLYWWTPVPQNVKLQFLPSIAEAEERGLTRNWRNATWTEESNYKFTNLKPYTSYNMTVYVRVSNTDEVYPPARYIVAATSEAVPSPPRNVTVTQMSAHTVQVSWDTPLSPNGHLTDYIVFMTPPYPPIQKKIYSTSTKVVIESTFDPGQNYSFWVVAKNAVYDGEASKPVNLIFDRAATIDSVQGLVVDSKSVNSIGLSWKTIDNVDGYGIRPKPTSTDYPHVPAVNVTANHCVVKNLSPGVSYIFEVFAYNELYIGPLSTIMSRTDGTPLPLVLNLNGELVKGQGTTVKLTWDQPKFSTKVKWTYGIYYATNINDLFDAPKITTTDLSYTVKQLQACESYVFDVGVVGPLGSGPLNKPVPIITSFNKNAPPKRVRASRDPSNENKMILEWDSSCKYMAEAIGYVITVTEVNLRRSSTFKLSEMTSNEMRHEFNTQYGGSYSIIVSTTGDQARMSEPIFYQAPPIVPPHQVQVIPEKNGSYIVLWHEANLPQSLNTVGTKYRVFVSEGSTINEKTAETFDTDGSPFYYNNGKEGVIYSFAVMLVTNEGYKSPLSEVLSYRISPDGGDVVLSTTSLVSVLVPIMLIMVALAAALGFFVLRHRRLQRSFSNFANSHYDTRSGSTTFGGADCLDDEDSPVIRGFSDDEPLVIA